MRALRERKEVNYQEEDEEVAAAREQSKQTILSFSYKGGSSKAPSSSDRYSI